MNDTSKMTSSHLADQPTIQTQITIYACGVCPGSRGPGGYAATLHRQDANGEQKKLIVKGGRSDTTIIRMPMEAAIVALGKIRNFKHLPITVCTDSQVLVNGMTETLKGWRTNGWQASGKKAVKNQDLWEQLAALVDGLDVVWVWVPSSACDPRKDEVKELANNEGREARVRAFET